MFMRVPGLCLYFPLILFGSLVAVAYFARPRVSLFSPGLIWPRPVFVFSCVFLFLAFLPGLVCPDPVKIFLYFFVFFCCRVNYLFIFGYH